MSPKAMAKINTRAKNMEKLLDGMPEDIKEKFLNGELTYDDLIDSISIKSKDFVDTNIEHSGVFLSKEDIEGLNNEEIRNLYGIIGILGECSAYKKVIDYMAANGKTIMTNTDTITTFTDGTKVSYPDADCFEGHQEGWDIKVEIDGDTYYLEVKTRTSTSVMRGIYNLSTKQQEYMTKFKDKFGLLTVVVHRTTEGYGFLSIKSYMNLLKCVLDDVLYLKSSQFVVEET